MKAQSKIRMALMISFAAVSSRAAELPAFQQQRYEENAAAYKDADPTSTLAEIKYIPLSDTAFLSLGGQVRGRWEV